MFRTKFISVSLLGLMILLTCLACSSESEQDIDTIEDIEIPFDQEKWLLKEGKNYPYRAQMVNDVLYNDTVRTLSQDQFIALLGQPDRTTDGHLYYQVAQKRLGPWPLHTTTMVVKLSESNGIEWIKLHE